jgi:hypothetical protein
MIRGLANLMDQIWGSPLSLKGSLKDDLAIVTGRLIRFGVVVAFLAVVFALSILAEDLTQVFHSEHWLAFVLVSLLFVGNLFGFLSILKARDQFREQILAAAPPRDWPLLGEWQDSIIAQGTIAQKRLSPFFERAADSPDFDVPPWLEHCWLDAQKTILDPNSHRDAIIEGLFVLLYLLEWQRGRIARKNGRVPVELGTADSMLMQSTLLQVESLPYLQTLAKALASVFDRDFVNLRRSMAVSPASTPVDPR